MSKTSFGHPFDVIVNVYESKSVSGIRVEVFFTSHEVSPTGSIGAGP